MNPVSTASTNPTPPPLPPRFVEECEHWNRCLAKVEMLAQGCFVEYGVPRLEAPKARRAICCNLQDVKKIQK